MSPLHSFIVFASVLFPSTYAYVDFGSLTIPMEPLYEPTPRPNQILDHFDLRYEVLPSMITAVAPSVTLAANGTHQTMYSLHYHHYFSRSRQGRGTFDKRGVFSGDPPIATCTPCGGGAVTYTPPTLTSSTASCKTLTYHGVFDYPPDSSSVPCYNSNYTGAFQPITSSSSGLPCCFSIPASCRPNSTMFANTSTTSFAATSGVFRSTTTSRSTLRTSSTSSRLSLSTPISTSRSSSRSQSQGAILNSGTTATTQSTSVKTATSGSSRTTVTVITGTTTVSTVTSGSSSSVVSNNPYTSASSSVTITTTSYSIIVISSTTITLRPSSTSASTSGSAGVSDLPTLTVITGSTTASVSGSVPTTTFKSNTIVGCGEASGSGIIEGTGTVFLAGTPITASGSASGYASSLSGCGTIVATTGSFSGVASITGCGFGYGHGTLTGDGTVWPWFGGGLISFSSSGTVSGAGSFRGCGTITGSGYFSATTGSNVLATPTGRPTRTVSVYLSYCPAPTAGSDAMFNIGSNNGTDLTASTNMNLNSTTPYISSYSNSLLADNSSTSSNTTVNPLCQVCPNSVGVCCPPTVTCDDSDGKCPIWALENGGNTINGYLIQQVVNSTAPVAGRKKVRALAKKNVDELGIGSDLVRLEMEVEQGLKRHKTKRKAHHKHF